MKEFQSDSWEKSIITGLRKYSENSRDEVELVECHNLCPNGENLELHELIYSLNSGSWSGSVPWTYLKDAYGVFVEDYSGNPVEVIL